MKNLLLFFLASFCWSVQAQNITISARVVDKETKEPLAFASVGIKGKSLGTITNLQGDFDFHLPPDLRNNDLVISILGYKNFEAPVWTLLEVKNVVIELEKSVFVLSEVVVTDSLKGGEVLRIALSRIEQNYPMQPYMMDGFYRDIKKVGGVYISLLEAAVKIYDEDYKLPRNKFKLRERVALLEVRRSLGYETKFTSYFDSGNLLEELLLNNNVKYRQFPDEDIFFSSVVRGKDSYYDGHEIYVLTHQADYSLTVYVDKKNYAIIHIDYENNHQEELTRKRGLKSKFVNIKRVIDFKPYENKWFLNYLQVDSKVNWYDARTDELKFETELNQQLLVNQLYPKTENWIGTTEKMRNYGLQYQDLPYNKEFWENYNVIKESPLDKKIIEDLERAGPLEKQFQNND